MTRKTPPLPHDPAPRLKDVAPGAVIQHLQVCDSTSDRARALSREHPGRVVLLSATTQTAARGSRGRSWQSPPGGAWFSLAVPMTEPQAATPLLVGRALAEVIARDTGGVTVKPPNDVLVQGEKIAGVLCEQTLMSNPPHTPDPKARGEALPATPHAAPTVVIGVGINVNLNPAALGDQLRLPATSLRHQTGRDHALKTLIDRAAVAILIRLDRETAAIPPSALRPIGG